MIKKYFWIFLTLILILAATLRIVNLDKNPPHLGNDEISIAFDSYSIRTTGKDEYGVWLPLSFISHRDYKAPLYAYLNIPFNFVFGNNEYGIRMLSVVSSLVAILIIALLARFLGGEKLALLAALLLTINPKNIFVSRMSYESNLASTLVLLGVYFIFLFREKQKQFYLLISGLFLGFSIWAYHTQKGLVPLLLVVLPWLCRKEIKLRKWWVLWITTLLIIIPIGFDFFNVQIKDPYNRASSQIWYKSVYIENYLKNTNDFLPKRILTVVVDPVYKYFDHFSFDILFTRGMEMFPKNEPLNFGWFLIFSLPVLIIGLFNLNKIFGKYASWVVCWCLLCPIVPSLTVGEVASVRNLAFVIPTILIMAGGFLILIKKSKILSIGLTILILINFFLFGIAYYVHFPKISGDNFQYGYKQAWTYIKPIVKDYEKIIIEPRFGINGQFVGLPRLYLGYFGAFNAKTMQQRDNKLSKIGKYWIKNIDWNEEIIEKKSLYIVSVSNPKAGNGFGTLELLTVIRNTNNEVQFLIYKTLEN
ncbi:MAG: glycosyltransferase family 39 protein [Candidatus Shapirobacteria bacterium]|jgi:4-amino-4-deoxy-L-arabinose transferase-like glycosyltransferase